MPGASGALDFVEHMQPFEARRFSHGGHVSFRVEREAVKIQPVFWLFYLLC